MNSTALQTLQSSLAPHPQSAGGALTSVLESRESQSVQVAMLAAKRFPRDEKRAIDRILNACCRESLAAVSQYSFARGGTEIAGPSIRLAEAMAQHWGNLECGWREIDRYRESDGTGVSVVEAYAWDLESNTRVPRVFNVRHWRDTKKGGYALADERDIYELCANQAARRLRACILAVIPGDVVETAIAQCNATLQSNADTGPETQKKMLEAFAQFGVTKEQIEARIQRRIDAITAAQVITLKKIYASLKDGMSAPADWFDSIPRSATGSGDIEQPSGEAAAPVVVKAAAKPKTAAKPAAQPTPESESPAEQPTNDEPRDSDGKVMF